MEAIIDYQHVKRMVKAGFTEDQAEAVASGITDRVATKADLDMLKAELKGDMDAMKAELKGDMKTLKAEIAWLMLIQSVAVVGLVVALLKL